MQMKEVRFASRPPIDSYGNGGFKIGGLVIKGSVLLLPGRIEPWAGAAAGALVADDFTALFAARDAIDFVLLGTGAEIAAAPKAVKAAFAAGGLGLDVMQTGAACRTYNVLLAENRRVAAALIAVA